jgi:hypothetical protein
MVSPLRVSSAARTLSRLADRRPEGQNFYVYSQGPSFSISAHFKNNSLPDGYVTYKSLRNYSAEVEKIFLVIVSCYKSKRAFCSPPDYVTSTFDRRRLIAI